MLHKALFTQFGVIRKHHFGRVGTMGTKRDEAAASRPDMSSNISTIWGSWPKSAE